MQKILLKYLLEKSESIESHCLYYLHLIKVDQRFMGNCLSESVPAGVGGRWFSNYINYEKGGESGPALGMAWRR